MKMSPSQPPVKKNVVRNKGRLFRVWIPSDPPGLLPLLTTVTMTLAISK
ncbi:hypothetical protein ACHAXS_014208 [Conticribra weissflogii]